MARNERFIPVPPQRVFDILADPRQYGYVAVGSKNIRRWDERWPRKGAEFHHTVGYGPLNIKDTTEVARVDAPRLLELIARGRPLGTAKVTFELHPCDGGTRVSMVEDPLVPKLVHLLLPAFHFVTRLRNREALGRLAETAQQPSAERERVADKQAADP